MKGPYNLGKFAPFILGCLEVAQHSAAFSSHRRLTFYADTRTNVNGVRGASSLKQVGSNYVTSANKGRCSGSSLKRLGRISCERISSRRFLADDDDDDDYESGGENDEDEDLVDASEFLARSTPSRIAVPGDTPIVLGVNKYSHDVSVCAVHQDTGDVLFHLSKERLSRKKHDAGSASTIIDKCLESLELDLDNVKKIVVNNHHHRVLPLEADVDHVEWQVSLGVNDDGGGFGDDENLLLDCQEKHELSHHLAHAYSAACQSPFSDGLVVVMDGMGETYRTMESAKRREDSSYTSDLVLGYDFDNVPSDIDKRAKESIFDWREGESAYIYEKNEEGITVQPIFKRWIEEKSPPTLYNHGFENMESVGAVYSRASSHIFGDWNACGKVMGLAPWACHSWKNLPDEQHKIYRKTMEGKLYEDDGLKVYYDSMKGTPLNMKYSAELFDAKTGEVSRHRYDFDDTEKDGDLNSPVDVAIEAISLASSVQRDLECIVLDFVQYLKKKSGKKNLCLAGGVALNSVLNGRLARELGFDDFFIPPYPGDDGISVGCAAFGLFGNDALKKSMIARKPPVWKEPLSPYLGPHPYEYDVESAISHASPWLEIESVTNKKRLFEMMSREIASGGVVAWYHGRSEAGPRALGHRSILADPRKTELVRFINNYVKMRESFRPFAPSVLAEFAHDWFEDIDSVNNNVSPFMSLTAFVKDDKRDLIPAVTHIDGSSRLQTVTSEAEPLYHELISEFFKLTGVPMILNTSFNTLKGEPIVESPKEAIRSFLCSMDAIEMLVINDNIIRRKKASLRKLLGEKQPKSGFITPASNPKRAGLIKIKSESVISDDVKNIQFVTKVHMVDRPMHDETKDNGWFELTDQFEGELLGICNGNVSIEDILEEYHPPIDEKKKEFDEVLFENIIKRLVRLHDHTFISW